MSSYLEDLKAMVAKSFENATSKEQINDLAAINTKIEEAQKEQNELLKQNAELLKDYKEVVMHSSVKPTEKQLNEAEPLKRTVSLEDALADFVANKGK